MIDFIVNVASAFLVGYAVCCWFPPTWIAGKLGFGITKTKGKRK